MWYKIKRVLIRPNWTEKQVYPWKKLITTAWIYHSPSLWLISISSDWTNWITMSDKNLWATTTYNVGDTMSQENCWNFYQRWNNYWFPFNMSVSSTTTKVNASNYWPWNYYSSSTFIIDKSNEWLNSKGFWDTSYNTNLRWNTTNTNIARQWPCPSWWHVPQINELLAATRQTSDLVKLPWMWRIWWYNKTKIHSWFVEYRASDVDNNFTTYWAKHLYSGTSSDDPVYTVSWPAEWMPIRPFKNTPVQPDDSWTVLYQPS